MKPENGVCFKMSNALFDEKEARQYLSIFGEDKMGCLWREFLQDTTETLKTIERGYPPEVSQLAVFSKSFWTKKLCPTV